MGLRKSGLPSLEVQWMARTTSALAGTLVMFRRVKSKRRKAEGSQHPGGTLATEMAPPRNVRASPSAPVPTPFAARRSLFAA
jgi:hypothetical protein